MITAPEPELAQQAQPHQVPGKPVRPIPGLARPCQPVPQAPWLREREPVLQAQAQPVRSPRGLA